MSLSELCIYVLRFNVLVCDRYHWWTRSNACAAGASAPGVYDVEAAPGADAGNVTEAVTGGAPQDDDMHDTTENEVAPSEDDFETADGFLRHVHSLRRLVFTPLPGGVGVRGVPGSTSTANLTLQGGDAAPEGGSAEGASVAAQPPPAGASGGGGMPSVTIEVLRNATYEEVVEALASKLGQCAPRSRCIVYTRQVKGETQSPQSTIKYRMKDIHTHANGTSAPPRKELKTGGQCFP